jgi:hypothetical protein
MSSLKCGRIADLFKFKNWKSWSRAPHSPLHTTHSPIHTTLSHQITELRLSASSLNSGDSYVLEMPEAERVVIIWHGSSANMREKQRALEVARGISSNTGTKVRMLILYLDFGSQWKNGWSASQKRPMQPFKSVSCSICTNPTTLIAILGASIGGGQRVLIKHRHKGKGPVYFWGGCRIHAKIGTCSYF